MGAPLSDRCSAAESGPESVSLRIAIPMDIRRSNAISRFSFIPASTSFREQVHKGRFFLLRGDLWAGRPACFFGWCGLLFTSDPLFNKDSISNASGRDQSRCRERSTPNQQDTQTQWTACSGGHHPGMRFDAIAKVHVPASYASVTGIRALIGQLMERCADLPGVSLHTLLDDAGPRRPDMDDLQKNTWERTQRMLPFESMPKGPKRKVPVTDRFSALVLPGWKPTYITASPRVGAYIRLAPSAILGCFFGYLAHDVPRVAPEMATMMRLFCPPGWLGTCFAYTESGLEPEDGGVPNAVAAHIAAIGVYDRLREFGLRMQVRDKADFHTERDVSRLLHALDAVRAQRIGQGKPDFQLLLKKVGWALERHDGRELVSIEAIGGPTAEDAERLSADPDAQARAAAEARILDLLRVVDLTKRKPDYDADEQAFYAACGM